ncbi:RNA polymerase sigma factor [Paracoccus tegillarcae]|uniref:RNA polymerase subunit sigma-70 n=1 Tax=Paracoccus tegillarcae TaxID=1529068 RepID=A0A2K9EGC3_9RHOB|nr:sigma-70 family RNA polymerase sigma factor [Paracoccus tegillarcae]AUH34018.1 RNA polymerase subunit sigma-70 [Paracoccus tegillarcae]
MDDPFTEEIIAFLPNLKRYAISLSRRPDLAEDLVQLTAERAFRNRHSFDPDTKLQAWLLRILRNAWIDMTRRDRTRGTQTPIEDAPWLAGEDGERVAEGRLMLDETRRAMEQISPDQRDVLVLVCIQEVTYQEAADILDIPIGTVMSRLARARKALSKEMGLDGWE